MTVSYTHLDVYKRQLSELTVEPVMENETEEEEGGKDNKKTDGDETPTDLNSSDYIERDLTEFIPSLKVYAIFQLLNSTLGRIITLYPSKFLNMAISAIMKFMATNINDIADVTFLLRRIHEFCNNYDVHAPDRKLIDGSDLNDEEIKKLTDDEFDLQNKLIKELFCSALSICLKNQPTTFDVKYFESLTHQKFEESEHYAVIRTQYLGPVSYTHLDVYKRQM